MSAAARQQIEAIYRAAVAAVDPRASVRDALRNDMHTALEDRWSAGVYLVAFGKAADAMAAGAQEALGATIVDGIVVTKEPPRETVERFRYMLGSHPVPDERSLAAGQAVLDFVAGIPGDAPVLCLISGGGSALVEALREGYDLADLQAVTKQLLRAGAPIGDLNAVRSRLSRIKGGGLLAELGQRPVVNLVVSDVLGDDLQAIASGPTVLPTETSTADDLARRYELDITTRSAHLSPELGEPETIVVANLALAIEAAADEAERAGLRPVLLADTLEGEAREVGRTTAKILRSHNNERSPLRSGDCVLLGGETTVTVRGNGVGGRNTEAALAAAIELGGTEALTVGFLATDGDDGVTGAAGAIVDGATISPEIEPAARRALENNDSYGFLSDVGAVWAPGATGTNVNDLVIAIIE